MVKSDEIRTAIQKVAGTFGKTEVFLVACTVESVDEDNRTCVCTSVTDGSEREFIDVNLLAVLDDGLLPIPEVGSDVIIMYSRDVEPTVISFSELQALEVIVGESEVRVEPDAMIFTIGESQVTVSDGSIKLNDGSLGGLIKIEDLVSKINDLEDAVSNLITQFNAHTHPTAATGSPSTPTPVLSQIPIPPFTNNTTVDDLENAKITHGENK